MLRLLIGICLLMLPLGAAAQTNMAADRITISEGNVYVAEGNVQIFDGELTLNAQRVVFNNTTQDLEIEGPLVLQDGTETVVYGSSAELDDNLKRGIILGARVVLDNHVQLTATELQRSTDRYNQAYQVAATSCNVCKNRPPIWHIRAKKVVHDLEEKQLYFDHAQLRILNVPVFYLPRMRLPDPSLKRATGFLRPSIRATSKLGWGLRVPYFIKLGDHADVTLTPYLSHKTRTLETRYRQAFHRGRMEWNLSTSKDDLVPDDLRWALFGTGFFQLNRGYKLSFDAELSSDATYTRDYDITGKSRLDSAVGLRRTRTDQHVEAVLTSYHTLRVDERNATQPTIVFDASVAQRYYPETLGGQAYSKFEMHSRYRSSDATIDGDSDGLSDGLDVARISAIGGWSNTWVHRPTGLVFDGASEVALDAFGIQQDPTFDTSVTRSTLAASFGVALPLQTRTTNGSTHLVTPRLQYAYVDATGAAIPNEDSTRVDFDEGNLFRFNRSPGRENPEVGGRLNLGLTWDRMGSEGWNSTMTLGRIVRLSGDTPFSVSSGLQGDNSNWLLSGQLSTPNGIALLGRITFQDDFSVTKNEVRADWRGDRLWVKTAFAYLRADPIERRNAAVSELSLDAGYQVNDFLKTTTSWRYDWNAERTSEAGLGIKYTNECVEIDLSVSRDFGTSSNTAGDTEFSWKIGLLGFGTGDTKAVRRSCR